MGNKQTVQSDRSSLNPQEMKRLSTFLEQKQSASKFTHSEIKRIWNNILVPDLIGAYDAFLFKSNKQKDFIGLEDFVAVYIDIIRGTSQARAEALSNIIGFSKNQEGAKVISYQSLCKYLSDLLDSYFFGLKTQNDAFYNSWTFTSEPRRTAIEQIMRGVCNDLQRTDDEVRVDLFENWLNCCGLVNTLHSYVIGSMYNLEPEQQSDLVPLAILPSRSTSILLDISQAVYLNSFLRSEYKLEWRFLFSTGSHGESFSKLVGCIVNEGPILFLIKTNTNNSFGGFISSNVVPGPKWIGGEDCFLFKLSPTVDVYSSTGYNDHYAYLNCHQSTLPNGLGMGGQYNYWGVWVDSQFGVGECSESCTTYKNYQMLDVSKKFQIKSMEVWGVGEPPPTEEERGERTTTRTTTRGGRSALDMDPTTTQLLEMAGRTLHSKGLRDSGGMKSD